MAQTFTCPSCGAPLDYDGSARSTIECLYCNSSVIVPQEMRGQRSERVSPEVTMSLQGQAANLRELSRLVKAGQKVQAYNLYQQVFKVSLTEAMRAVDQLSQGGAVVITSNVVTPPGSYGAPPAVSTSPASYTAPPIITTSARVRFAKEVVPVPLGGQTVWTRYYTPREFESAFAAAGFRRLSLRALGLFSPPPYLAAFASRRPRLVSALQGIEDRTAA